MSSHASPSLEIEPARQAECTLAGLAIGILAVVPGYLAAPNIPVALVLAGLGAVLGAAECRRIGWLSSTKSVTRVFWRADGTWHLRDSAGIEWPAQLRCGWVMPSRMALLKLGGDFGSRWVLAARHDPNLRRLTVRLRLSGIRQYADAGKEAEENQGSRLKL